MNRLALVMILVLVACIPSPQPTRPVEPSKPAEIAQYMASASPGPSATPAGPKETAPPSGAPVVVPSTYTVQPGEWIYSIGRKFGLDPSAVIAANPGIDPNRLVPGQVINLPQPGKTPTPKVTPAAKGTPVPSGIPAPTETQWQPPTETPWPPTQQPTPASTATQVPPTQPPDQTKQAPTSPPLPTPYPGAPYPEAPLCADSGGLHNNGLFHTLWDSVRGCHYDHEHGRNPFTPEVAAAFPGFDLYALLGNVQIGHTNPSSPMENTHKHTGFKWDVTLSHTAGCAGREGVATGVDALAVQYHNFGDYSVEFESRTHSAVGLMRQCQVGNPTDYGYVFANQLQDYGQRTARYQGVVMPYPDTPLPAYDPAREPYLAADCFGPPPCDKYPTREYVLSQNANTDATWISEPVNLVGSGSPLFGLLFRARDTFQILDWNDQEYPFTFRWMCSEDGGLTYSPVPGCRYNNTTTRVNEVMGDIPAAWDNLVGFDIDPRVGRVTAEGYVTRFGVLNLACTAPGTDCHPIQLVQAFTGRYGSLFELVAGAESFARENLPERDIYFCGGQVCWEDFPGAVPSGWIGQNN